MSCELSDLPRLFSLRRTLQALKVNAPPQAWLLSPLPIPPPEHLGVLCGSFNPPTLAHVELADTAAAAGLDYVVYAVAKVTVDKETVTGLTLEDRLLLLRACIAGQAGRGVALVNRGLYVEQACAFRALFGSGTRLTFVVGMDKLFQVLDPSYYVDRDEALDELFSLASLMVANRGGQGRQTFAELLDRPANRAYRPHIRFLPLSESVGHVSSSNVRGAVGGTSSADVPEPVARFLADTQPYVSAAGSDAQSGQTEAVNAYVVRLALLERLAEVREWAETEVDFAALIRRATAADAVGRALRTAKSGADLRALILSQT